MKGFVHFVSGLAVATCFPQAVELASRESSFIIAWGGIFGILPDTLDFKFVQFWQKYDYQIDPDPERPDMQKVADAIAAAIHEAHETGQPRSIQMLTIKKGADLWREYRIAFDTKNAVITTHLGPLVNTSQKPFAGSEIPDIRPGKVQLRCKLAERIYEDEVKVDIMNGPSLNFIPQKDGSIKMDFIPWHRNWSHSLLFGAFLGLAAWLILWPFLGASVSWLYGLVIAAAYGVHILEDQLGYMGSNLFWPLTGDKIPGLQLMHSGDAWPNFLTVWLALMVSFYNLNYRAPSPVFNISWWVYCAYVIILPLTCVRIVETLLKRLELGKRGSSDGANLRN